MTRIGATTCAALATLVLSGVLHAQGSIKLDLPADDPFPAAPKITVHAVNFDPNALRRIRLRASS